MLWCRETERKEMEHVMHPEAGIHPHRASRSYSCGDNTSQGLAVCRRAVGDRQGLLEALEAIMQTRVAIKWVRNPFAVSLRFPG